MSRAACAACLTSSHAARREPTGFLQSLQVLSNLVLVVDDDQNPYYNHLHGVLRTRLWNCRACERDRANRADDDCDGRGDEVDPGCERTGD